MQESEEMETICEITTNLGRVLEPVVAESKVENSTWQELSSAGTADRSLLFALIWFEGSNFSSAVL